MNISLRNIKYCAWASEETPCFKASLYLDGKLFAMICNDGRGGADRYDPPLRLIRKTGSKKWWATLDQIHAYFTAHPHLQTQYGPLPFSLELWTGEQLADYLNKKTNAK